VIPVAIIGAGCQGVKGIAATGCACVPGGIAVGPGKGSTPRSSRRRGPGGAGRCAGTGPPLRPLVPALAQGRGLGDPGPLPSHRDAFGRLHPADEVEQPRLRRHVDPDLGQAHRRHIADVENLPQRRQATWLSTWQTGANRLRQSMPPTNGSRRICPAASSTSRDRGPASTPGSTTGRGYFCGRCSAHVRGDRSAVTGPRAGNFDNLTTPR